MGEKLKEELKVKDEEPEPKRRHVLETLDLTEEICEPPGWDRLPYHLTVQVYSHLKNSDRGAMARVCQAWYKSFKDPSLWRSREFTFGGPNLKQSCRNMISFASMFGSCLQDVVIRFRRRTNNSRKHITETLETLTKKLEIARLCRLELLNLKLDEFDRYPKLRDTICRCLVQMFKSQTALKQVVIQNSKFYDQPAKEVLNALQESSGHALESLKFIYFFRIFTRCSDKQIITCNLLPTDYNKFTNLRQISIYYCYISEEILQQLTINLKTKLKYIRLVVLDFGKRFPVIASETWRNLAYACPQLKVDLSVYDFCVRTNFIPCLVPGMPLTKFFMKSRMKQEDETKLASILRHLADYFDQTLESLKLVFPYLQDSVYKEITRIVEMCRELKEIRVPASVGDIAATALSNNFRDRQVQKVLFINGQFLSRLYDQPYEDVEITFNENISSNSPDLKEEWVEEIHEHFLD